MNHTLSKKTLVHSKLRRKASVFKPGLQTKQPSALLFAEENGRNAGRCFEDNDLKFNVVVVAVSVELAANLTLDIAYVIMFINAVIFEMGNVESAMFTGSLLAKVDLDPVVGCAAKPHTHVVFTAFKHIHEKFQLCILAADTSCGHCSITKTSLAPGNQTESGSTDCQSKR